MKRKGSNMRKIIIFRLIVLHLGSAERHTLQLVRPAMETLIQSRERERERERERRRRRRRRYVYKNRTEKAQSCSVKKIAMLLNIVCVNLQTGMGVFSVWKNSNNKNQVPSRGKREEKRKEERKSTWKCLCGLVRFAALLYHIGKKKKEKLKKDNNNTSLDID